MAEIVLPGHKLGQMVGNFFESLFFEDLSALSSRVGMYCDHRGPRPGVRGRFTRVTWIDDKGNKHDLDYVIEIGGSLNERGQPAAFLELAWRRYTKHSRNKTGEIEGALLHLRDSHPSCRFLGAILAGEYTEGGKSQLASHGIVVLHIPSKVLASAFRAKGVELDYPEDAPDRVKRLAIERWEALSATDLNGIRQMVRDQMRTDYTEFTLRLERALLRAVVSVTLLSLYGQQVVFASVEEAVAALLRLNEDEPPLEARFVRFEVRIQFSDGDEVGGRFGSKEEALRYLRMFSPG